MADNKMIGEIGVSDLGNKVIEKFTVNDKNETAGYFKNDSDVARFAIAFAINKKLDVNFTPANYKAKYGVSFKTKWHYASIDSDLTLYKILISFHPDVIISNDYIQCLIDCSLRFINDNYLKKNVFLLTEIIK